MNPDDILRTKAVNYILSVYKFTLNNYDFNLFDNRTDKLYEIVKNLGNCYKLMIN